MNKIKAPAAKRHRNFSKEGKAALHKEETFETALHRKKKGRLGIFRINRSKASWDEIAEVIADCGKMKNHLIVPEHFIRAFDEDIQKASIMAFLLYMEAQLTEKHGEWFIAKYPDITRFTGVSHTKISKFMGSLRDMGILQTERWGVPSMQHYSLDHDVLEELIYERTINYKEPLHGIFDVV
jgi:hypothetical protein